MLSERGSTILRAVSIGTFSAFLIVMLGTNSVVRHSGLLTWGGFWTMPAARGVWTSIGPVSLLPIISVLAWFGYRREATSDRQFSWGWRPMILPAAAFGFYTVINTALRCLDGTCGTSIFVRLTLLFALIMWVYLFIINERPNLVPTLAIIITLQSLVAIGQFLTQRDLGLQLLGELSLDPSVRGVSVVINQGARWLRGYGLTTHPNGLARTLVISLLALRATNLETSRTHRIFIIVISLIGLGGLASTLSRWAWFCLLVGGLIGSWPAVRRFATTRRLPEVSWPVRLTVVAIALGMVLFGIYFGGAAAGRLFDLGNPVESISRFERLRDMGIGLQLMAQNPLAGIGLGNYIRAASLIDPFAKLVPSTLLYLGSELGLIGLILWSSLFVIPVINIGKGNMRFPKIALWAIVFLIGLFYVSPNPVHEVSGALLVAMPAAIISTNEQKPATHLRPRHHQPNGVKPSR